jgi:uridine phosphorylase
VPRAAPAAPLAVAIPKAFARLGVRASSMRCSLESRPVALPEPTSIHLRPTAGLAERALLPGDPGRALALAQALIAEPRMFNHHRGLWGYTGPAHADGEPLTIQATGMGGPSAAIVLSELIALGARRFIRVGTCGALDGELALGDLLIAREAICRDGASRALGCGERVAADAALTRALEQEAGALERASVPPARRVRAGSVVSVDLFYGDRRDGVEDALAIEMEAAALFAVGARAAVPGGCILAVSDTFDASGARRRIEDRALLAAAEAMGRAAVKALAA